MSKRSWADVFGSFIELPKHRVSPAERKLRMSARVKRQRVIVTDDEAKKRNREKYKSNGLTRRALDRQEHLGEGFSLPMPSSLPFNYVDDHRVSMGSGGHIFTDSGELLL